VEQALKHGSDANLCDPEAAQQLALRIAYARLLLVKGSWGAAAAVLETIGREARVPVLPPASVKQISYGDRPVPFVP
jgi:hypothetical protein